MKVLLKATMAIAPLLLMAMGVFGVSVVYGQGDPVKKHHVVVAAGGGSNGVEIEDDHIVQGFPAPGNQRARNNGQPGEAVVTWNTVTGAEGYRVGWLNHNDFQSAGAQWLERFTFVNLPATRVEYRIARMTPGDEYWFIVATRHSNGQVQWPGQWIEKFAVTDAPANAFCPVGNPQLQPTATPRPQPTATPQPQPTATPQPQPTATPRPQPTATPQPQLTNHRASLLWLVNDERRKHSKQALIENSSLNETAQKRANTYGVSCFSFRYDDPLNSWVPAGTQGITLFWEIDNPTYNPLCWIRSTDKGTVEQMAEHIASAMQKPNLRRALLADHRREIGMGIHKDSHGYVHIVLLLK